MSQEIKAEETGVVEENPTERLDDERETNVTDDAQEIDEIIIESDDDDDDVIITYSKAGERSTATGSNSARRQCEQILLEWSTWAQLSSIFYAVRKLRKAHENQGPIVIFRNKFNLVPQMPTTTVQDKTIYAFEYQSHGCAIAKFGETIIVSDCHNMSFYDQEFRSGLEQRLGIKLLPLRYLYNTGIDFCGSSLGTIIIELMREYTYFDDTGCMPEELRPVASLRNYFQRVLHRNARPNGVAMKRLSLHETSRLGKRTCGYCKREFQRAKFRGHYPLCRIRHQSQQASKDDVEVYAQSVEPMETVIKRETGH